MKRLFILLIIFAALLPSYVEADQEEDFTLSRAIEIALERNHQLRALASEIEAHGYAYQASKRLFNPSLGYELGNAASYDGTVERNTSGVSLSQYLENPLKRLYRIRTSESEWQASRFAFGSLSLDVIFEVKRNFYMILMLDEKEALAERNFESLEQSLNLVEIRVRLGETRELEAIRLQVEVMRGRNELNSVRTEKLLARNRLNSLLGESLPTGFSLAGELTFDPLEADELTLRTKALQDHPLIGQSQANLAVALNQLQFSRSSRIPDPELSGFMGDELDGRNRGIGISVAVPLWNFGSKEIAEARSISNQQEHELEALQLEISIQVSFHLNRLRLAEERISLFQTGLLRQAEESMSISEISYREGEISLIEYLDSQRIFYSIQNEYHDSLFEWNLGRAALENAIGADLE